VNTRTQIKRGAFAKDTRTGQVVKVAEAGGRDVMVRPAYKSDGYWVSREQLDPAQDPHEWTWKTLFLFLVSLAMAAGSSYGMWTDMHRHGVPGTDAFVYTAPSGLLLVAVLNLWFKVTRP